VAADFEGGFEAVRTTQPSLVVVDALDLDATVHFVRWLRQDPATRPTAIAILDPDWTVAGERALRDAGANMVLATPVDSTLWNARLDELLSVPRRRAARITVRIRTWSRLPGEMADMPGLALNISVRGVLLECERRLEIGTRLDVSFVLPGDDRELSVLGEVVRQAGSLEEHHRYGVKFAVLRDDAQRRIAAFVDETLQAGVPRPRSRWIEERAEWEAELRASETRKSAILEAALDAIITMDHQGRIVEVNRAAEETFGYVRAEFVGSTVAETVIPADQRDAQRRGLARYLATGEGSFIGRRVEVTALRKDGSTFPAELAVVPLHLPRGLWFTSYIRDITERKEASQRIHHQAFHDALTGLPNRSLFTDRLSQALALARRSQAVLAVLFMDLDLFKRVNDTLGHSIGDRLLKTLSVRLAAAVREADTVGRVGGDEFIVLLTELANAEDAAKVASKLLTVVAQPFEIDGHTLYVSGSVGISTHPSDGADAETLLRNADTAMYRAKERGRGTYQMFTAEMNVQAVERLNLEQSLRRALAAGQFRLRFQPLIRCGDSRIVGFEALLRWHTDDGREVTPGDFIELAEDTRLVIPIGEWVLRHACQVARGWQDAGHPALRVSVNVSPRQFEHGGLVQAVARALEESRLSPESLELEVTESAAMQNVEASATAFRELAALGARVAIDDFGTGHASLGFLKRFPIQALKIDRTFVADVTLTSAGAAIVRAITQMAHSLGLRVVAEGVETAEQAAFLRGLACDELQGFHFGQPLVEEAVLARLGSGA
jgi:diguanylate cyclase (GGDEF)-like protein/PAS domain S-box-containing protein